ncbi:MAG: 2-oxoglutarate dehydrogenase E1 component [Bacteroidetes bacterium]|nr:2-oxoglutarate dehydrogenase E1 component [Bacteroidota bacterium]
MSDTRSYLSNAEVAYIDYLYELYEKSPNNVDFGWQKFFEGYAFGQQSISHTSPLSIKEIQALHLIRDYRTRGHLFTQTNPVRPRRQYFPKLTVDNFGLTIDDLETEFEAGNDVGLGKTALKNIIALLEQTYCQSIGAEYAYIRIPERVEWLKSRMEKTRNIPKFSIEEKKEIFGMMGKAVGLEQFLNTKFVGQKRFSIEGGEACIAALNETIERGAELGIEEFVLGMAHRGRLNVLTNILGKAYKELFSEFDGKTYTEENFEGDVKYHLGYQNDRIARNGKLISVSLAPNPSHLEAVNPVVEGIVRAKIDLHYHGNVSKIAPILIHGDGAAAGQGIMYETIQMSGLEGFTTGGTIHIVINNQVSFTTNYTEARTSTYSTDVAKTTLCPVFHVNGDDAEAVVFVTKMALEYRQKFYTDVWIDVLCYRKYGHNEGDEPRFTQPLLYKSIGSHKNPREAYSDKLIAEGSITEEYSKQVEREFRLSLQNDLEEEKKNSKVNPKNIFSSLWKNYKNPRDEDFFRPVKTQISKKKFQELEEKITTIPKGFTPINKIEKLFADRKAMAVNNKYDWAMGELMAYATLLEEGYAVRLSGQDVERGTFSHRHAVIKKEENEEEYIYLNHLGGEQAKFQVYNTILSEYGSLGFEYGYALAMPKGLTIWEAQFGDFANGAQIMIDQFISCGEAKWKTKNGLVMLLPHGYEGQGPEHSSARLERFLQLCANNNMMVCNVTTPAQLYHLLRTQMHRNFRVPIIIMSPKSLLRHPLCISTIENFTNDQYQVLIDDTFATKVKRVLFCSGKIYFDLYAKQQADKRTDIAIIRIEQLFPMPTAAMDEIYKKYKNAAFFWVQEEPQNMGAWLYILSREENRRLKLISRKPSPSTATGYYKIHHQEQESILREAFEN